MSYGQKNFLQAIGIPPTKYRIDETGCFLTGFCNGLEDEFQINIDPAELNARFRDQHVYVDAPPKDGVLDDLGWGSISSIFPDIVVSGTGTGIPPSSNAMVKFIYRSPRTGNETTHFCWVQSSENHTIIDSWDGIVKNWDVYGGPKEWATYDRHQAVQINPVTVSVNTSPSTLGCVNVAGLDLSPAMRDDLAGGMKVVDFNAKYAALIPGFVPISGARQLPEQQPIAPTPEHETPAQPIVAQSNVVYTRLENPLNLVTNKQPTHKWHLDFKDDANATSAAELDNNIPFVAAGKAQRTDGDKPCYYMAAEDFGKADETGVPASNVGINTVDLSPAPIATAPIETVTVGVTSPKPEMTVSITTTHEDPPSDLLPSDFNGSWKDTYKKWPGRYVAAKTVNVSNLDGTGPLLELVEGENVTLGGYFDKEGKRYYRAAGHVRKNLWYGIPEGSLKPIGTVKLPPRIEDEILDSSFSAELKQFTSTAPKKAGNIFKRILMALAKTLR